MADVTHMVKRADCTDEYCTSHHLDDGDPFQPFRAMAAIDTALDEPDSWTTREGETLLMRDMTDSHLRNTIRFLRRRSDSYVAMYRMALDVPYPMFNGEMAQMLAEADYDRLCDERMKARGLANVPTFRALCREQTRRIIAQHKDGTLARRPPPLVPTASW